MWCIWYVVIFLEYLYVAWWWIFKDAEKCYNNNNQQNAQISINVLIQLYWYSNTS
jgi:hypothetical protein